MGINSRTARCMTRAIRSRLRGRNEGRALVGIAARNPCPAMLACLLAIDPSRHLSLATSLGRCPKPRHHHLNPIPCWVSQILSVTCFRCVDIVNLVWVVCRFWV
ncbi:hypothetical protein M758_9G187300 [Ceratodon purpureus]|nr:hypothetical protein M758_9G187300 [Ceratodon purpureus]